MPPIGPLPAGAPIGGVAKQTAILGKKEIVVAMRDGAGEHQQAQFDQWYSTLQGPAVQWEKKKSANAWRYFAQCANIEDGSPLVRCALCSAAYQHPALFRGSTSNMNKHLSTPSHRKAARELVYGKDCGATPDPDEDAVLAAMVAKKLQPIEVSRRGLPPAPISAPRLLADC